LNHPIVGGHSSIPWITGPTITLDRQVSLVNPVKDDFRKPNSFQ
jgi:hypothetical protein